MALLDRFRPKPAWQHEDPAVRAAAVRELPGEEQERLADIARSDADPRVRRAAVRKLDSAAMLSEVIREDADAAVREDAAEALAELLQRSDEGDAGRAALETLQDPRLLAAVARSARDAALRHGALERLSSPKALAELARKAEDPEVRRLALERVSDAAALEDVALRSEHKDVALQAVERLDREALRSVAAKAHNRTAARRARALLAEAGEELAPLKPAAKRARRLEIIRTLEGLARSVDFPLMARELESAAEAWSDLRGRPGTDDQSERRYLAARAPLEERLAHHEAERQDGERRREQREAARQARIALWEEATALRGGEPEESLDLLRSRFEALPPWDDPEAGPLLLRFQQACGEARERRQRFSAGESARERLEAICRELEAVTDTGETGAAQVATLVKQAAPLLELATPELRDRYHAAGAAWRDRGEVAHEERAREEQENHARVVALVEQMLGLARAERPRQKDAEAALREARERLGPKGLGPLPSKRDRDALTARLKEARAALYPRVQELRDTREWAQWAREGAQEELCGRAEALLLLPDMEEVVTGVKDLDARWVQATSGPKQSEALRERFKAAREQLRVRCDAHFAEQARERSSNLERKLALCQQAEAVAESTDWLKTAQLLVGLQAQWKALGPVPQREARAVWERFRKACDRFFSRRKEDLSRRKDEWGRNLELKEALCAKAEALVESSEWETAATELKRLQAEWKTLGPVRKSRSEAVWQRFRKACDAFFERYKKRDEIGRAAENEKREALCQELESLAAGEAGEAGPDDLLERVQRAQAAWRQAGAAAGPLQERFGAALHAVVLRWPLGFRGTELDPEANRQKREKLCAKVEGLLPRETEVAPTSMNDLAARLKEALASNTMGARKEAAPRVRVAEEVEAARAAWKRTGPVPGDAGRALLERFEAACRKALASRPRS